MNAYRSELHIHTVLSPCAGVEMIPPLIVETALEKGVKLIAITDHNSAENISAVKEAAEGYPLIVLAGIEIETREEVHNLCIFDTIEQAKALQNFIYEKLPAIQNNPEFFGEQFLVDCTGEFLARNTRLLSGAADISIEEAYQIVKNLNGLFIPAHVNRKAYGLINVLGMIPDSIQPDALEISRHITPEQIKKDNPQTRKFSIIQNGDVHYLDGFLGTTVFYLESPTIAEIKLALNNTDGRHTVIEHSNSSL